MSKGKVKPPSLVEEYFELQQKYVSQYGERTVVLTQTGNFYETWQFDPTFCASDKDRMDSKGKIHEEQIGHSTELSQLLPVKLTMQDNNKPYTFDNPHKLGFQYITFDKFKATLLASDFVIVRVDQQKGVTPKPGERIPRHVVEIISPTMEVMELFNNKPTNNIISIYLEYQSSNSAALDNYDQYLITVGISALDTLSGKSRVCEFFSKIEDSVSALQDIYRFLILHCPREVIINVMDVPEVIRSSYTKYIEGILELRRYDRVVIKSQELCMEFKEIPYQIEFLNKIFTKSPSSSIIRIRNDAIMENLNLHLMTYGRISYLVLLQYCFPYKEVISKISKPETGFLDENRHLILTHNATIQLNILPESSSLKTRRKEMDCLRSVLDETRTNLGKKLLNDLLLNPLLLKDHIQQYYDMVEELLVRHSDNSRLQPILEKSLRQLPDIGRLQRKLSLNIITPRELSALYRGYLKVIDLYCAIVRYPSDNIKKYCLANIATKSFNEFISNYSEIFNFEALETCNVDKDGVYPLLQFVQYPFRYGSYVDLDAKAKSIEQAEDRLQQIVDYLNTLPVSNKQKNTISDRLCVENVKTKIGGKKTGLGKQRTVFITMIRTTPARAEDTVRQLVDVNICGQLRTAHNNASERKITSDLIDYLCNLIDTEKESMKTRLYEIYMKLLEEMTTKYDFYTGVANLISKLDIIQSYANVSYKYDYHKPEIVNDNDSSFNVQDLRHPVIERIISTKFITNDFELKANGKCIFGVNGVGKSSLGRSVALAVIMAQIGCFVPGYLKFSPYSKIITRICSTDNILANKSTFVNEIIELRTILRQADSHSLIIADEIAGTTDICSSCSISVATIMHLIERRCSFIMASHIHELLTVPDIKKLSSDRLEICHLSVTKTRDGLIYDRKLLPGAGDGFYGILVAETLDLPLDFIRKAYEVAAFCAKRSVNVVETKKSRYNKEVYITACEMCGLSGTHGVDLDTHHINEQRNADERKMIGHMHMNIKDNLMILCKKCHRSVDSESIEMETKCGPNGTLVKVIN